MNTRIVLGGLSLVAALALTACGGESGENTGPTALSVAADATQLKFAQTTLEASAGKAFTVNFNNPSTTLPHNWVLVPTGQEDAVTQGAVATNGDATGVQGVLAAGKPITGSQEAINVPAQQAGSYSFICTVPGHYAAGMKGTLTVK